MSKPQNKPGEDGSGRESSADDAQFVERKGQFHDGVQTAEHKALAVLAIGLPLHALHILDAYSIAVSDGFLLVVSLQMPSCSLGG